MAEILKKYEKVTVDNLTDDEKQMIKAYRKFVKTSLFRNFIWSVKRK